MKTTRDFRTPADSQDFETLYDRAAKPPLDFKVLPDTGASFVVLQFKDFSGVPERDPTVKYKAYFVPFSVATLRELGVSATRQAAIKLAKFAGEVSTNGRGEWLTVQVKSLPEYGPAPFGGYFLAVGVNRRGVESEPTLPYRSPYN